MGKKGTKGRASKVDSLCMLCVYRAGCMLCVTIIFNIVTIIIIIKFKVHVVCCPIGSSVSPGLAGRGFWGLMHQKLWLEIQVHVC